MDSVANCSEFALTQISCTVLAVTSPSPIRVPHGPSIELLRLRCGMLGGGWRCETSQDASHPSQKPEGRAGELLLAGAQEAL